MSSSTSEQDPQQQLAEPAARLSAEELQAALRAVDPGVFLVVPRILRRVIKHDRRLSGFGLRVPHRKSYVISRAALLQIVEREELGLESVESSGPPELASLAANCPVETNGQAAVPLSSGERETATCEAGRGDCPDPVILLARPDPEQFAETPADEALVKYWRLLFHARVHVALEEQIARGRLSSAVVRQRIHQIGQTEFDEIRAVLRHEDFLLPPRDAALVYVEFAAVYLELRWFAPSFLPRYFPSLDDLAAIDAVLAQDLDAAALFRQTRPLGAPDPAGAVPREPVELPPHELPPTDGRARPLSDERARKLLRRADRAAALGNVVRAAVLRVRASRAANPRLAQHARAGARRELERLIGRLRGALDLEDEGDQPWQAALEALLEASARGVWTVEARLLYDLQKVCVDHEREIYTVDLVEWGLSLGRRPIKRELPAQRDVLMSKHLRSAGRRLRAARLSEAQREQVAELVHAAAERADQRLRERFRPRVVRAFDAVGLEPRNVVEGIAREKLIEELLDRIVERGFVTMGDLRDALSRNNLKLDDLSGPEELVWGDPLLGADRRLAAALDGVYHGGEFYLRWMQRFSSLAFGTRAGRFLTKYVAIPFGGAFVLLEFAQYLAHHVEAQLLHQPLEAQVAGNAENLAPASHPLPGWQGVLLLGMFLFGLIHVGWFRRGAVQVVKGAYRGLRGVFVDAPLWLYRRPLVQRVLRSPVFQLGLRFVVKPLALTVAISTVFPWQGAHWPAAAWSSLAVFLAVNLLLNSRLGRNVEEMITDWAVQAWHRVGLRILTGLFWLIMDVFHGLVEAVERLLYTVDEWLRFKSGESRMSQVIKAGLGLVWFFVTYVVRFCVNLLIEPQINPIKHFPVVTVSHKLLIPLIPTFAGVLSLTIDKGLAYTFATAIIFCIPGIFGFLVWELKENWRLYAANRPGQLRPVIVGHHGETMIRFMKPGLHSGTLPKLYARLRRAERKARATGNRQAARKHLEALHHVELSIRRFVERDFLALLARSRSWQSGPVEIAAVHACSNRVRVELVCPRWGDSRLVLALEEQSGWLLAGWAARGWYDRLSDEERQVLRSALLGWYKYSGVDLVREQIEATLPRPTPDYDVSEQGLVVWPEPDYEAEVVYNLHVGPKLAPKMVVGTARRPLPVLERSETVFRDLRLSWSQWVDVWQRDHQGGGHPRELAARLRVLPADESGQ